jgi:hypothetical protein
MSNFIESDVLPLESDTVVRLQHRPFFEVIHGHAERTSYLYELGHKSLFIAARSTMSEPYQRAALDIGASTYETIGFSLEPYETYGDDFSSTAARVAALEVADFRRSESALLQYCYQAKSDMLKDAPNLTELVREIAGKHVDFEKTALAYALLGSAAMRSMQRTAMKGRIELAQTYAEA